MGEPLGRVDADAVMFAKGGGIYAEAAAVLHHREGRGHAEAVHRLDRDHPGRPVVVKVNGGRLAHPGVEVPVEPDRAGRTDGDVEAFLRGRRRAAFVFFELVGDYHISKRAS